MPNWKEIVHEKSESDQLKLLEYTKRIWKEGESKDGFICTWVKQFKYKDVPFLLKIMRYFNFRKGFTSMPQRSSDKHVLVEYPPKMNIFINYFEEKYPHSSFLYHDTLFCNRMNKCNLEKQLDYAFKLATQDIDGLSPEDYLFCIILLSNQKQARRK